MFKTRLLVGAVCCALLSGHAMPASPLMPSPVGVAITVGQWIWNERNKEKMYYIRVQGRGYNEDQARQAGFKLAVEYAVGSLVLAESTVVDQTVARSEIISYSSGYVDNFKIINSTVNDGQTVVEMDVWVKGSRIADRLLGQSKDTTKINGDRISEQVRSLQAERTAGDRVLNAVLLDYPSRAFVVKTNTIDSSFGPDRSVAISLRFSVAWDYNYLTSLYQALENTAQASKASCDSRYCPHAFVVNIKGKDPSRTFFSIWSDSLGFNDNQRYDLLYRGLQATRPAVQVKVIGTDGRVMHQTCYYSPELDGNAVYRKPTKQFVHFDSQRVIIDGTYVFNGELMLATQMKTANISEVMLAVVNGNSCKN